MVRSIDFRYMIQKNGADYCELYSLSSSNPTIKMNESSNVKISLSGDFLIPAKEMNWLTDEIQAKIIIDGVPTSCGVFLPSVVTENEDGINRYLHIDALDRCWLAQDCRTEHRVFIPAGTNYVEAVVSVLGLAGISQIASTQTTFVTAEDREDWAVGTSILEIVNQLLSEISYKPLWFDGNGVAMLEPATSPTAQNIDHVLDDTKIESLIIPGINRRTDLYNKPNVFVCVCSNADKENGMVAIAENTNPQSPLSISRRGRRITQTVPVQNIPSQEALQLYANRMVTDSLTTGETIDVTTALLPGFGVGDVTAIKYGDLMAICLERSWSMEMRVGGAMTHNLEQVVLNLD